MLFTQKEDVTNAVKEKLRDCIRQVDWLLAWKQILCARTRKTWLAICFVREPSPDIFLLDYETEWWIAIRRCAYRYAAPGQFYAVLECIRSINSRWIYWDVCQSPRLRCQYDFLSRNTQTMSAGMLSYLFRRRLVSAQSGWGVTFPISWCRMLTSACMNRYFVMRNIFTDENVVVTPVCRLRVFFSIVDPPRKT